MAVWCGDRTWRCGAVTGRCLEDGKHIDSVHLSTASDGFATTAVGPNKETGLTTYEDEPPARPQQLRGHSQSFTRGVSVQVGSDLEPDQARSRWERAGGRGAPHRSLRSALPAPPVPSPTDRIRLNPSRPPAHARTQLNLIPPPVLPPPPPCPSPDRSVRMDTRPSRVLGRPPSHRPRSSGRSRSRSRSSFEQEAFGHRRTETRGREWEEEEGESLRQRMEETYPLPTRRMTR